MNVSLELAISVSIVSFLSGVLYCDWKNRREIEKIRSDCGKSVMAMMELGQDQLDSQRDSIAYRAHLVWVEAARQETSVSVDGHKYLVHEQYEDEK